MVKCFIFYHKILKSIVIVLLAIELLIDIFIICILVLPVRLSIIKLTKYNFHIEIAGLKPYNYFKLEENVEV